MHFSQKGFYLHTLILACCWVGHSLFFTLYPITWLNDSSQRRSEKAGQEFKIQTWGLKLQQKNIQGVSYFIKLSCFFLHFYCFYPLSLAHNIIYLSPLSFSALVLSSSLTSSTGWEYLWELRPECKEHSRSGICRSSQFLIKPEYAHSGFVKKGPHYPSCFDVRIN